MGEQVAARLEWLIAQLVRAHADKREVGGSSHLSPLMQTKSR